MPHATREAVHAERVKREHQNELSKTNNSHAGITRETVNNINKQTNKQTRGWHETRKILSRKQYKPTQAEAPEILFA